LWRINCKSFSGNNQGELDRHWQDYFPASRLTES